MTATRKTRRGGRPGIKWTTVTTRCSGVTTKSETSVSWVQWFQKCAGRVYRLWRPRWTPRRWNARQIRNYRTRAKFETETALFRSFAKLLSGTSTCSPDLFSGVNTPRPPGGGSVITIWRRIRSSSVRRDLIATTGRARRIRPKSVVHQTAKQLAPHNAL